MDANNFEYFDQQTLEDATDIIGPVFNSRARAQSSNNRYPGSTNKASNMSRAQSSSNNTFVTQYRNGVPNRDLIPKKLPKNQHVIDRYLKPMVKSNQPSSRQSPTNYNAARKCPVLQSGSHFSKCSGADKNNNYFGNESPQTDLRSRTYLSKRHRTDFISKSGDVSLREKSQIRLTAVLIKDIRAWRVHTNTIEIVFDLYAALRETPVRGRFNRLELSVKDQSGVLGLVYYEIDAVMPRVPIGTWLKISCVWRYWGLQAVKVSIAEPNFSQNFEQKLKMSRRALEEKLAMFELKIFQ